MNYERKYKEALEKIKGTLFYRENNHSLTNKLDADKVIKWIRMYWPFTATSNPDDAIAKFKKDFKV